MTDGELLRRYVQDGSHDAFAELMARHAEIVYAAARRQVGDAHQAEDVAQAVFIVLARKAHQLVRYPTIAGWLIRTTHFAACAALRHERRLARREQAVRKMAPSTTESAMDENELWNDIKPLLDEAIAKLRTADRDAVALRYLESKSLAEVAAALGTSEEAAAKRISRAVQKLRDYMHARGISVQASILTGLMLSHGRAALPPALKVALVGAAAHQSSAASLAISKGVIGLMQATTMKISAVVIAAALLISGGGYLVYKTVRSSGDESIAPIASTAPPGTIEGRWNPFGLRATVTAGTIDPRGHLWIASEGQGFFENLRTPDQKPLWQHVSMPGGIDPVIYALASDTHGRIWVGKLREGVWVFNGKDWKNYTALDGPLGPRIFRIAVCPKDSKHGSGDVWIATDAGLARYQDDRDTWQYFTRAQGLPSDQANSIAFDAQGNVFVGTQSDGLAIGQASDDYKTWRHIDGPNELPMTGTGPGLPSNAINDVLVMRNGMIVVATPHGVAKSTDDGKTFTFFRGLDWINKAKTSITGVPANWKPDATGWLIEDYVTCLAEDATGYLCVGYRTKGCEIMDGNNWHSTGAVTDDYCSMILPVPGGPPIIGSRQRGIEQLPGSTRSSDSYASAASTANVLPPLPQPALTPIAGELQQMTAQVRALKDAPTAAYLNEDWATQGDWVGRYGREQVAWPNYGEFVSQNERYTVVREIAGPHNVEDSVCYNYFASINSDSPKALWAPGRGKRMLGEWNDGGFHDNLYNADWEGPDLWIEITVPQGMNRVSLHFYSGTTGKDLRRDYPIEIRQFMPALTDAQKEPVLARSRFIPSLNPVYKNFLLPGGHYWIRVASNFSYGACLRGIFMDQADITAPSNDDGTEHELGTRYDLPAVAADGKLSDETPAAMDLWSALDQAYAHGGSASLQTPYRMFAYRAAAKAGAPDSLLERWRWVLHLWTPEDRSKHLTAMTDAWKKHEAATQATTQPEQPPVVN